MSSNPYRRSDGEAEPRGTAFEDPLVELARIVGDDGVFAFGSRQEPRFEPATPQEHAPEAVPDAEDEIAHEPSAVRVPEARREPGVLSPGAAAPAPRLRTDDQPEPFVAEPAVEPGPAMDENRNDEFGFGALLNEQYGETAATDGRDDDVLPPPLTPSDPIADIISAKRMKGPPPPRKERSSKKAAMALAGVAGIAALGAIGVLLIGESGVSLPSGEPPVILATAGPIKVMAESKSVSADRPGEGIYRSLSGEEVGNEIIVPRAEEPVALAKVRRVGPESSNGTPVSGAADLPTASWQQAIRRADAGTAEPKVAVEPFPSTATNEKNTLVALTDDADTGGFAGRSPLGGRQVRTTSIAPGNVEATRQEIEAVPQAVDIKELPVVQAKIAAPAARTIIPQLAPPPDAPVVTPAPEAPVMTASPTPRARPSYVAPRQAVTRRTTDERRSAARPIALVPGQSVPATASTAGGAARYTVQVSSQRSGEAATRVFEDMRTRYSSIVGSYSPDIQRADLGDRGVYYRVRIGPMRSQAEAADFCSRLKSAGGDCFVTTR